MRDATQVARENVLAEYSIDEMFLGHSRGMAVATMILQEVDDRFWPAVHKGESLFLHKLSVRRSVAKQGFSAHMIMWAEKEAITRQKRFLRLDCAANRPRLCLFYESLGFVKVKEELMGKYPTAFYEVEVGVDDNDTLQLK